MLSQPKVILEIGFTLDSPLDFHLTDQWLGSCELVEPSVISPGPQQPFPNRPDATLSATAQAHAFLYRALLISAHLQMAARVPCFEPGEIIRLQADPQKQNHWKAGIAVVVESGFTDQIPKLTLRAAISLLLEVNRLQPDVDDSQRIFHHLNKDLVEKITQKIPGGKSSIPILSAAHRNGIPFMRLKSGAYQLGWGSKARLVERSSIDLDSRMGAVASENKLQTAQMLHDAGLPAPQHYLVRTLKSAQTAAQALGWPLVVKPADRNRGEGVTIDVDSAEKLAAAFEHATKFSKNILVEEQVQGTCYRVLVAKDQLIYAVKRNPKSVKGDGESTLLQLVEKGAAEQRRLVPWKRKKPPVLDDEARALCAQQGYVADSIIPKDMVVNLRKIESTEWGGTPADVTTEIHPENIELAVRASRLIGLSVCGVDIISADIAQPWYANNAKILELNFAPFFFTYRGEFYDKFFGLLFPNSSRIPIQRIDSRHSDATERARQAQMLRCKKGERCYLIIDRQVFRPDGTAYPVIGSGPQQLVRALLQDRTVDAIVVVL